MPFVSLVREAGVLQSLPKGRKRERISPQRLLLGAASPGPRTSWFCSEIAGPIASKTFGIPRYGIVTKKPINIVKLGCTLPRVSSFQALGVRTLICALKVPEPRNDAAKDHVLHS